MISETHKPTNEHKTKKHKKADFFLEKLKVIPFIIYYAAVLLPYRFWISFQLESLQTVRLSNKIEILSKLKRENWK